MASTYLTLVNRLRTRFNEPDLSESNWTTVVGFDKLTKDAINYAIRDICNAETEWPFVYVEDSVAVTTPGVRTYTLTVASSSVSGSGKTQNIRKVDWESFYVNHSAKSGVELAATPLGNDSDNNDSDVFTIPSSSPYEVDINDSTWTGDVSVETTPGGIILTRVNNDPSTFQYGIARPGVYTFHSAQAGLNVIIEWMRFVPATQVPVLTRKHLPYIELGQWRQFFMEADFNLPSSLGMPLRIYRTQSPNKMGLSPIPNTVYDIHFGCWVSPTELSAIADTHFIPDTFEDVILDGAAAYCYTFREDQPLAKEAKDRHELGINRMRTELINFNDKVYSGFNTSGRVI